MPFYTTNYRDGRHIYHKNLIEARKYAYSFVKNPNEFHPHVKIFNGKTGRELAMITNDKGSSYAHIEMETEFTHTHAMLDGSGRIIGERKTTDAFQFYAFTYADTSRRAVQGDYSMSLKEARVMAARLSKEKGRAIRVSASFTMNGRTKLIPVATYKNGKMLATNSKRK